MRRLLLMTLLYPAISGYALAPLPSQFVLDSWGTKSGLAEEMIYSVTQTPDGYLWLATANGLVEYDGNSFRVYQPRQDLGGGVKQEISRLGPGPDNSVWVYSLAYGLVRFQNGVFRRAPIYPTPCNVEQIRDDQGGTLVVCHERVLRIVGERVDELTKPWIGPAATIQTATRDERGQLWIGLTEGGMAQLGQDGILTTKYGHREGMPAGSVNCILAAGPDRLWVGTDRGLVLIESGRVKVFNTRDGLPSSKIRRLTMGRDGLLWVGTTAGVGFRHDGRFESLQGIRSLPSDWVQSIYEDREENIWITFSETSLYRLRKPKFLTWGTPEGLPNERLKAIVQSRDAVWIAHGSGLERMRDGKLTQVALGPNRTMVDFLEEDGSGRIWALTADAVFVVDPESTRARRLALPAGAGQIFSLNRDRQGRVWILTASGLFLGEDGRVRPVPMAGLPTMALRSGVHQSRDGRLWLSVLKEGLFELVDGKAVRVSLGDDPELDRIHTFYIDSNDDFWFGLDGGGLARWRHGKLTRWGNQTGKPQNFIYHFAEDTEGYFWLGMRAGLTRVHKADLNSFLDGRTATEPREDYFDSADGLRSSNFGSANRTVPSTEPASILWFCSLVGAVRIDARNISVNHLVPPIHLLGVLADDHLLPPGETVSVPAGAGILSFRFSVPTLVDSGHVRVRYRLEPHDPIWRTSHARSVTYPQVPPGEYTFTVRATNNDGLWNERGASVKVVVLPRFYQTWWFRLLVVALAASCVAGVYRWRTMRLRWENAELERRVEQRTAELSAAMHAAENAARVKSDFLATMSHEIRTPMHGVLTTLELLSDTHLNPQQCDYLNIARNSSNSLMRLLNDILDLSKMEAGRMELRLEPFSLRQTVDDVMRLLRAQADLQGISLSSSCNPSLPEYFEGDEMRLRQVIFNLAGNAVKFTAEGRVTIGVSGQHGQDGIWDLIIAIRDTGIGIPHDRIPHLFHDFVQVNSSASRRYAGTGLGLAICQRLAFIMNGSISVDSEPGRGSTFSLLVPLRRSKAPSKTKRLLDRTATTSLFNGSILLAEDNVVNQKLATVLLEGLGCSVTLAQNGVEAVEWAGKSCFAIIFMDCQMPEMDGFEASRTIRSRFGDGPVIIAMTANALPGDRERCLEAGMNDYLAKPFQRSDLVQLLDRYLPAVELAEQRLAPSQLT
jgi:signal transduction histidine kinase/ligand-binding sensor domain-containing protein/CheY-like chemotaxis protein